MKHKIIIINGPNLNLLGEREKEKYGNFSLKDVENDCLNFSKKNDMEVSFYQSNIEGELIDSIQESRDNYNGLIINAGGYTTWPFWYLTPPQGLCHAKAPMCFHPRS